MAVPNSSQARDFYRCAIQRYGEAQVLIKAGRTTGAVYLAGYGVECILKALLLNAVPGGRRVAMLGLFRGGKAHDYAWLRALYLREGGAKLPVDIARQFVLVEHWSTDLRYVPRTYDAAEATAFLRSVQAIIQWASGRL